MSGFNNAGFRDYKRVETIGGAGYIDTTNAYYNSTMYEEDKQVISDMIQGVLPVFNCVPKIVNISSALATSGYIEPVVDEEFLKDTLFKLGLEQEKIFIARELILGKSVLLELQSVGFTDGSEENPVIGTTDFPYALAYYSADEYEIKSMGGVIYYCKINGKRLMYDEKTQEYTEKDSKKVFVRQPSGECITYEEIDGEKFNEYTFANGFMPIVEITTTYDMKQLFYSVDRYNELDVFIRNIFYLSGEPMLTGTGVTKLSDETANTYNTDRYQKMKTWFTRNPEANLEIIELQGNATRIMIEKQAEIKTNIIQDFPEYAISEVLQGGNVSEETTRIRLTEVLSRVQNVRESIEIGFNAFISLIYQESGKMPLANYITLGDMMEVDIQKRMNIIKDAIALGLISRDSAMFSIKTLFIGEDVIEEKRRIESDIAMGATDTGGTVDNTTDTKVDNTKNTDNQGNSGGK